MNESKFINNKCTDRGRFRSKLFSFFTRTFITCILVLVCMILFKKNIKFKNAFYKEVYTNNFSFAKINNIYNKYFGGAIPFSKYFSESVSPVFSESINYSEKIKYGDGVKLVVGNNYNVPAIDGGIVVSINDTGSVIIKHSDDVEVEYTGINNISVKLYDYVEKGTLIGECSNELYLVFKKDGNVVDYQKYI